MATKEAVREDLFYRGSIFLTPLGRKIQKLIMTQEGLDQHFNSDHRFEMTKNRLREEQRRARGLAEELGYWDSGRHRIDHEGLARIWRIILEQVSHSGRNSRT